MTQQQPKYEEPVGEVQQETPTGPIPVEIIGTVTTQAAPAIDGDLYSVTLPVTTGVEQIAGGDARRSSLVIVSASPFLAATSREGVRNPSAALWPANLPLPIRHRAEVWVKGTVADQVISASVERWAD